MDNRLVVWNPCSGETKWIKPRNNYYNDEFDFYALGYDNKSSCKKYKILRVHRRFRVFPIYNEYEIYDFTTDSWRVLGGTSDWYLEASDGGVSVKGNTYLIAFDRVEAYHHHGFILSFDFSTDRFRRLSLPCQNPNYSTLLAAREDQLYLCFHYSTHVHVWVTTISTGSVVSWSRLLELNASHRRDFNIFSGVSFLANEQNKLVLCCNEYLHASPDGGNLTCKSRCSLLLNYVPSLAPI